MTYPVTQRPSSWQDAAGFQEAGRFKSLFAPAQLVFYDQSWKPRGNKHDLSDELSQLTGIDPPILKNQQDLSEIAVARRMSWAGFWKTTRTEDLAYCLLGIFDVNMTLIYGEGEKAFIRLQEAIAHSTDDFSLFAWSCEYPDSRYQEYRGMFAKSPAEFSRCRHVAPFRDPLLYGRQSFTVTNRGLRFQAPLRPRREEGDYIMKLLCEDLGRRDSSEGSIAICLKKGPKGFARHKMNHFIWFGDEGESKYESYWHEEGVDEFEAPKYLTSNRSSELSNQMRDSFRFQFDDPEGDKPYRIRVSTGSKTPIHCWDPLTNTFFTGGFEKFTGLLRLDLKAINCPLIPPRQVLLLFGLTPEEGREEFAMGNTHDQTVRPWLALYYSPYDSSTDVLGQSILLVGSHGPNFEELADAWEVCEDWKEEVLDYANELLEARTAILADFAEGYSPPTALVVREDPVLDLKAPKQLLITATLGNDVQRKGETCNVTVQIAKVSESVIRSSIKETY
jgi:hypothetical protein